MAHLTADRVKETTTTTGTGAIALAGAIAGFRAFSSILAVGDTCYYSIASLPGTEWEVGVGTYSALNTLTRTTVLSSSNAGSAVTFSAGIKEIFITAAASRFLQADNTGVVNTPFPLNISGTGYVVSLAGDSGGSLSLGRKDNISSAPYIDFNSGATTVDFDTRLAASGGTGVAGNGTLTLSGNFTINATTVSSSTTTGALIVSGGLGVAGALNATTKSFVISHPTKPDKLLRHGSLEGPEFGVYVRGRTTSGFIELPEYWSKLVDPDTITVNLTPIGTHKKLYVESVDCGLVVIKNADVFSNNTECFYTIFAERIDVDKLLLEVDAK